jgi:hypothetical protein
MTKHTKEEKEAYFAGLRARWNQAKEWLASNKIDEIEAVMMQNGLNFSIRSYVCVLLQMQAMGLDGIPYVDCKTFGKWKESGFMVRKGEHSRIDGITWKPVKGKNGEADKVEPVNGESSYMLPVGYHLFHRTQVEPLTTSPVATVSNEIAEAFGMKDLPNVRVIEPELVTV